MDNSKNRRKEILGIETLLENFSYPQESDKEILFILKKYEENPLQQIEKIEDQTRVLKLKSYMEQKIYQNENHFPPEAYSSKTYDNVVILQAFLNSMNEVSIVTAAELFADRMAQNYEKWKEMRNKGDKSSKNPAMEVRKTYWDESGVQSSYDLYKIFFDKGPKSFTLISGLERIPPESLFYLFPLLFIDSYQYIIPPTRFLKTGDSRMNSIERMISVEKRGDLLQHKRFWISGMDTTDKVKIIKNLMKINFTNVKVEDSTGENTLFEARGVLSNFDYLIFSYFSALTYVIKYIILLSLVPEEGIDLDMEMNNIINGEDYSPIDDITSLFRKVISYDFTNESDLSILLDYMSRKILNEKEAMIKNPQELQRTKKIWEYLLTMIRLMKDIKTVLSVIPRKVTYPLKFSIKSEMKNFSVRSLEMLSRHELMFNLTSRIMDYDEEEELMQISKNLKIVNIAKFPEIKRVGGDYDDIEEEEEEEGEEGEEGEEEEEEEEEQSGVKKGKEEKNDYDEDTEEEEPQPQKRPTTRSQRKEIQKNPQDESPIRDQPSQPTQDQSQDQGPLVTQPPRAPAQVQLMEEQGQEEEEEQEQEEGGNAGEPDPEGEGEGEGELSGEEVKRDPFYFLYKFLTSYIGIAYSPNPPSKSDYMFMLMQLLFNDQQDIHYSSLIAFQEWPLHSTLRMFPELNARAYLNSK
jgi:hypothetical protein